MKTLLFHIHTEKSHDSELKIKDLIRFVIKNKIDYFCVTDHHNFEACKIIEKILRRKEYLGKTQLIPGIEIKTEYGDVISCFIKKEIKTRKFLEVVEETKKQKGLLILPHPFVRHKNREYVLKHVQGIEVWNSPCRRIMNKKAKELAKKYPNLIKIAAVDAHSKLELGNALNEIKIGKSVQIKPIFLKSTGYIRFHIRYAKTRVKKLLKKYLKI